MRSDPSRDYRTYEIPMPTRISKEGVARLGARAEYWKWKGLVEEDAAYGTSNTTDGVRRRAEVEGWAEVLRSLGDDPDNDSDE
jgi:hypothetical protein